MWRMGGNSCLNNWLQIMFLSSLFCGGCCRLIRDPSLDTSCWQFVWQLLVSIYSLRAVKSTRRTESWPHDLSDEDVNKKLQELHFSLS